MGSAAEGSVGSQSGNGARKRPSWPQPWAIVVCNISGSRDEGRRGRPTLQTGRGNRGAFRGDSCFLLPAQNYSPSGKDPLWSYVEWGMSTRWCVLRGAERYRCTTSTSLKCGERRSLFLWCPRYRSRCARGVAESAPPTKRSFSNKTCRN